MLIERRTRDPIDFPGNREHPPRSRPATPATETTSISCSVLHFPALLSYTVVTLDPVHKTSQRRQRLQGQHECNGGELEADWAAAGWMPRVNHPMLNIGMQEVRSGVVVLSSGVDLRRADGLTNEIVTRLVGQRS